MSKTTANVWFVKIRGSYLPRSWQGWILYIPFILFLLATLYISTKGGRTPAGIFYFLFPQYVSALVLMHWIASRFTKS